jgi:demethylmacrocin O-methyltransferase
MANESTVTALLRLAARPPQEALPALTELGHATVVEALLTEIAERTRLLSGPQDEVPVQWELGLVDQLIPFILTVGPDHATVEPGHHGSPDVVIRQDLVELLHALYGEPGRHDATRELILNAPDGPPGTDPDGHDRRRREAAVAAARACVQATTPHAADLTDLAIRAGTDKWGRHWYPATYERHLQRLRDRPVKVLEFGSDEGESLRMWARYFWRGQLLRVDSRPKGFVPPSRTRAVRGAQDDHAFLSQLGKEHGPFDLIIDDGSHLNHHVVTCFTQMFPHLRFGGLYVIEDIGASYWPGWGGSSSDLNTPTTTVGFLKTLLDSMNHQQLVRDQPYEPSNLDREISALFLHHNIAFVEKGANTERGAPKWISESPTALFL